MYDANVWQPATTTISLLYQFQRIFGIIELFYIVCWIYDKVYFEYFCLHLFIRTYIKFKFQTRCISIFPL